MSTLTVRPVELGDAPEGAHLSGQVLGGLLLAPYGRVEGTVEEPPAGRVATRGWLALPRLSFHLEGEEEPVPPYVEGFRDQETGVFYPSSQVVSAATP